MSLWYDVVDWVGGYLRRWQELWRNEFVFIKH
jgi:hypothetical protein